ncbi:hybrid sensor histidine kinase/response regulator, partial [Pseudomonas sp. MWU12-2534b]
MTVTVTLAERAMFRAPRGRDREVALMIHNEAGFGRVITPDLGAVSAQLEPGAGLLLIATEGLHGPELETLLNFLEQQPAW